MGAFSSKKVVGNDLDFESEQIAPDENETFRQVEQVLTESDRLIEIITNYQGCQDLARAAMSTPTPETEKAAFEGLLVAVDSISDFYNYSKQLERVFPLLLTHLSHHAEHLDQCPGLSRQLARIFNFALEFDRVRMLRPNLANDFSYYRRLLPKFNKHPEIKVKDDEASGMALFTAEHIPMTNCLAKAGLRAVERNPVAGEVLATMANSCMLMLKNKKVQRNKSLFCARSMTGAVVVFDHVDSRPGGAFGKKSPVALKSVIVLLKKDFAGEAPLLNAVHFSTKNFRDAPANIQSLFE